MTGFVARWQRAVQRRDLLAAQGGQPTEEDTSMTATTKDELPDCATIARDGNRVTLTVERWPYLRSAHSPNHHATSGYSSFHSTGARFDARQPALPHSRGRRHDGRMSYQADSWAQREVAGGVTCPCRGLPAGAPVGAVGTGDGRYGRRRALLPPDGLFRSHSSLGPSRSTSTARQNSPTNTGPTGDAWVTRYACRQ